MKEQRLDRIHLIEIFESEAVDQRSIEARHCAHQRRHGALAGGRPAHLIDKRLGRLHVDVAHEFQKHIRTLSFELDELSNHSFAPKHTAHEAERQSWIVLLIEQYKRHERATKPRNTETNESRKTPRVAANAKKGQKCASTRGAAVRQRQHRRGTNSSDGSGLDATTQMGRSDGTKWTQQRRGRSSSNKQQQAAAAKQQQGARKQLILF